MVQCKKSFFFFFFKMSLGQFETGMQHLSVVGEALISNTGGPFLSCMTILSL